MTAEACMNFKSVRRGVECDKRSVFKSVSFVKNEASNLPRMFANDTGGLRSEFESSSAFLQLFAFSANGLAMLYCNFVLKSTIDA